MIPERITIQWHLTEQCNLRCKHCYQDNYLDNSLPLNELKGLYLKVEDFARKFKSQNNQFKAHINFTGGEPFLYKPFTEFLEYIRNRNVFSFGILTNGYLLPVEQFKKLISLKPGFIQLSLEGTQDMNDKIRGNGSYNSVIKAIKFYKKAGIRVLVSFTANALNYKQYPEVAKICRKYKVDKLWTDRYLPENVSDNLLLTKSQTKEYFNFIAKAKWKTIFNFRSKTEIASDRALQFLTCGGKPYTCSAGKTLLTIMPNGDVLPCRRLPIVLDNLKEKNLMEIYLNNPILQELRKEENLDSKCINCSFGAYCKGGLKCMAYKLTGSINTKDPHCWIN